MPNYVYNEIIFYDERLIDKIWDDEQIAVDFGILIPEPKTKEECISKYGDKYIDKGDCHRMHEKGAEWFNWYDWRCCYWGTKWNAIEGEMCLRGDGTIIIKFSTAWGPPSHWIEALSEFGIAFTHYWKDEFDTFGTIQDYN